MSGFIVKARNFRTLQLMFYTGRAGTGWISDKLSEAFIYSTESEAGRKRAQFQRQYPMHTWMYDCASPDDRHNEGVAAMSREACGD